MLGKKQKEGKVNKGSKYVGTTNLTTVTSERTEKGASETSMVETILIEDSVEQSGMTKDGTTIPVVNSVESSAGKSTTKKSWRDLTAPELLQDLSRTGYYCLVDAKFKSNKNRAADGERIRTMQDLSEEMGAELKKLKKKALEKRSDFQAIQLLFLGR